MGWKFPIFQKRCQNYHANPQCPNHLDIIAAFHIKKSKVSTRRLHCSVYDCNFFIFRSGLALFSKRYTLVQFKEAEAGINLGNSSVLMSYKRSGWNIARVPSGLKI